ncbi:hypothetical protein L2E82_53327 [Cichorium intybus]|nr:hypothetical protein L2E82_53327 [Cichorium intybus]
MMRRRHEGPCDPSSYHESSQQRADARVDLLSNKCIPSRSRGLLHVLALELLRYAAQENPPDAQGKQSLVALLKRYARVEVAAQADIQPPVTNQTPTHAPLRLDIPRKTIQLRATPLAPRPSKQPKAKTTPRMHRTIREQVH